MLAISGIAFLLTVPSAKAAEDKDGFVAAFRCPVLWRLTKIHERGPIATSRDRFLVVALRRDPQSYVQCLFMPGDAALFCEASSGAFRYAEAEALRLAQSAQSVAVLNKLGFVRPDPGSNFQRELPLGSPPRLEEAATLMLTVLHDAYGAELTDAIEMEAPKASDPDTGCRAPGIRARRRPAPPTPRL